MIKNNFKKTFVLLEPFVVIAIIITISAIILSSLNTSRTRGADASIKVSLTQAVKQMELYYGNNNESYGTFTQATCPVATGGGTDLFRNDSRLVQIIANAVFNGGNGSSCSSNGNLYAVAVGLKTLGQSWCVDSRGRSKQFAGIPSAAISGNGCN